MKKTTFWALLFTAFTCIHCFGQPLSNIYSYPSEQGTNLHIRSLNAGKDLIYHCTNTIYHTFLCQPDRFYFSNLNMNMYKYTIPPAQGTGMSSIIFVIRSSATTASAEAS